MDYKYAVVTNYSFDSDMPVRLFDTEIKAKDYLRTDFENECRIDDEEGNAGERLIDDDGWYAKIDNDGIITEWRLGCIRN